MPSRAKSDIETTTQESASSPQKSQSSSGAAWEEADCIVDERGQGRTRQYLVKWKGHQENGEPHPDWWVSTNCIAIAVETHGGMHVPAYLARLDVLKSSMADAAD